MMKKNGFTLAEVLITLAIIGVVATMTLPALMTNTQEQQAKTGLKKAINTLTEAAQMNQALEGWDFASATETNEGGIDTDSDLGKMNFESLLGNRLTIDYTKGNDLPTQMPETTSKAIGDTAKAVYLKDGSAIYYTPTTAMADGTNTAILADNLAKGYVVFYDTNGASGPNILSNCAATALGKDETVTTLTTIDNFVTAAAATAECTKAKRVIKDIFAIRLRNATAQPEGAAATWAFNGDVKGGTTTTTTPTTP